MIPRKKLNIPEKVSGRGVSNRGVHLLPAAYHGDWLKRASYWTDLLVSMGISWVVIINAGDSVRQEYEVGVSPVKLLLDHGIIPIIREQKPFPRPFTDHETFLWTLDLYGQYGLKPFWIIRNEPFDHREWKDKKVPSNAWEIIMEVWAAAAQFIASKGGYVGFPDGPCYRHNPFESIKAYDCQWIFDEGLGFYTGHHYGKNRPRDYPYDAVTRHGAQLTESAYRRLLDDYADDRTWWEEPLELLNQRRRELQTPDLMALVDDTCWRGWEKIAKWSLETFGYVIPMAMTEGGWVPRDRPGTGPDTDIRMPHTTPRMVGKKTLQMFDTPSPFFALCPWLLADDEMVAGGYAGWPFDSWVGWAYADIHGREKPVVKLLQDTPPKEIEIRAKPMVIDVNADTRSWSWVEKAYGASYQRGTGNLRLIEVHEYEGPATLDVWVVDSDGLPVEGIPFYYHHPSAPSIGAGDEWHDRGVLKATGPDGRISFEAVGETCQAGSCVGAIWPKGKGDILEGIGLIEGTANRRLNGLWQYFEREAPPPPATPPLPEPSMPSGPAGPSTPPLVTSEFPPPPGPPPDLPESERDKWALLLDKLDRIVELLSKLPKQ